MASEVLTDDLEETWKASKRRKPWHMEDPMRPGIGLCGATATTDRRIPIDEGVSESICKTCIARYHERWPQRSWRV